MLYAIGHMLTDVVVNLNAFSGQRSYLLEDIPISSTKQLTNISKLDKPRETRILSRDIKRKSVKIAMEFSTTIFVFFLWT